jgi:hypothetical protein
VGGRWRAEVYLTSSNIINEQEEKKLRARDGESLISSRPGASGPIQANSTLHHSESSQDNHHSAIRPDVGGETDFNRANRTPRLTVIGALLHRYLLA